jgi:lysophospholipase
VPAEEVSFSTSDGVSLAGWWLDNPDSRSVVICCHGHRGNKADMLGIGPGLWREGHNVLLFDFRGSGDSGNGRQSLAHYEQADLTAALDWVARSHPGTRITVMAFSMGASTAILTAAQDPRIEALVLDSPFATMSGVIAANYRRYRLPGRLLLPAADLVNRIFCGYAFEQVRPIDAMKSLSPRPVLLLHGTEDRIIPYEHARQLAEAAGPGEVELVTFEGADHCGGYFVDRPGYIARVARFLEAVPGWDQASLHADHVWGRHS